MGALVVALAIGVPNGSAPAHSSPPPTRVQQVQGTTLLPYYTFDGPARFRLPGLHQPLRPIP